MAATSFDPVTCLLGPNSSIPGALTDAWPLGVLEGPRQLNARQYPLEVASATAAGWQITGSWSTLAANTSQAVAAGELLAFRRATLGTVPFGTTP